MKYDRGIKREEIVTLEIPERELEIMVELDYQQRLANASPNEVVTKQTPVEIIEGWNRAEYNSWRTHHRYLISSQQENDEGFKMNVMDVIADNSREEAHQRQASYREKCQEIRRVLNPEQAEMIIAICLEGMAVKDYALQIGDTLKNVSKRFNRVKNTLREQLTQNNH